MSIISQELAQKLVNYVMEFVPNNINIIDENGIIIASGFPERIGHEHKAGLTAIREKRIVKVLVSEGGMIPGVNLPITFHDRVCGAVGISGPIDETINIASLVKCTIELLITQEALINSKRAGKLQHVQFIHEWLNMSSAPTAEFIARGKQQNILVTESRTVSIISFAMQSKNYSRLCGLLENHLDSTKRDYYYIRLSNERLAVILNSTQPVECQLKEILSIVPEAIIGVGSNDQIILHSFRQAQSAHSIGTLLEPDEHIHQYASLRHYDAMLFGIRKLNLQDEPVPSIMSLTADGDQNLIETLIVYFRCDGEVSHAAELLHVHRNTLNYRLEKIAQLTGLNPHRKNDLFRLISDLLIWNQQLNSNSNERAIRLDDNSVFG